MHLKDINIAADKGALGVDAEGPSLPGYLFQNHACDTKLLLNRWVGIRHGTDEELGRRRDVIQRFVRL
jgi:hypothetical protein